MLWLNLMFPYNIHINTPVEQFCSDQWFSKSSSSCNHWGHFTEYRGLGLTSTVIGLGAAWALTYLKATCKTSHIICRAWCKIKIQGSLFRNYEELKDWQKNITQSVGLSEHRRSQGWLPRWIWGATKAEDHGLNQPSIFQMNYWAAQSPQVLGIYLYAFEYF